MDTTPADSHEQSQHEHNNHAHDKHQHHDHSGQSHDGGHAGHKGHDGHSGHGDHHAHMLHDFKRRFWISLVLTVPILVLSPTFRSLIGIGGEISFPGSDAVRLGIATILFFYGGWPFLSGLVNELKKKQPGMMTLIAVAITTAYGYSAAVILGLSGKLFFWELATLIDVMLLGHWIEMRSVMGASRALDELATLLPGTAHRLANDGSVQDVGVEELSTGDRVVVKPGESIPADGEVTDGTSDVNEAMLTGESRPVNKESGDTVVGGSLNGNGSITIEITGTGDDTYVNHIITMVRDAQQSSSKTQNLVDRAAFWLTVAALASGTATFVLWLLLSGHELVFALERAVTVLVITCPHALGLAVPLVVAVSTSLSAKNGLLIRNRAAFERARKLDAVIFDKTGTLTTGDFSVTDTVPFEGADVTKETLISLAAAVESRSEHPIGRAIADEVEHPDEAAEFSAITGNGVQGTVGGKAVMVVKPGWLDDEGIEYDHELVSSRAGQGQTVVVVVLDGAAAGIITLGDRIREESREAVRRLSERGISCMMITGDNDETAKWVAGELGLDEYFAEVLPDKKEEHVRDIQSRGKVVAMVGDGINDAPALARADVGIAIGAGTDVAAETADIILVRSNPSDVPAALDLAAATYRKMVQNLFWATGYNVIAIPLAAGALAAWGILLSPAAGAILMSASTVIVAINARRLNFSRL